MIESKIDKKIVLLIGSFILLLIAVLIIFFRVRLTDQRIFNSNDTSLNSDIIEKGKELGLSEEKPPRPPEL